MSTGARGWISRKDNVPVRRMERGAQARTQHDESCRVVPDLIGPDKGCALCGVAKTAGKAA